mmetsp:Transcript_48616/g.114097  ORF Transcript_48616/g.114097 Transcript_48616/m.114097 type:complete len:202 (-) Transcript_48616:54-659(-)
MIFGMLVGTLLQPLDCCLHGCVDLLNLLVPADVGRNAIRLMGHPNQPPEVLLHVLHEEGDLLQKKADSDLLDYRLLTNLRWFLCLLDLSHLRHGTGVELWRIGVQAVARCCLALAKPRVRLRHLRLHATTHLLHGGHLLHHCSHLQILHLLHLLHLRCLPLIALRLPLHLRVHAAHLLLHGHLLHHRHLLLQLLLHLPLLR